MALLIYPDSDTTVAAGVSQGDKFRKFSLFFMFSFPMFLWTRSGIVRRAGHLIQFVKVWAKKAELGCVLVNPVVSQEKQILVLFAFWKGVLGWHQPS